MKSASPSRQLNNTRLCRAMLCVAMLCIVIGCKGGANNSSPAAAPKLCAFGLDNCIVPYEEGGVGLEVFPLPLHSMRELEFKVYVKGVKLRPLFIDLSMPGMYMGPNKIALSPVQGAAGIYAAKGVLSRCPTGGKLWRATVLFEPRDGHEMPEVVFEFEVAE